MQTKTIDFRTDKELEACLRVKRPVAVLAYDYTAGDYVPVHEHAKAQLIYAVHGTMTVSTRNGQWVLFPTQAAWIPAYTKHSIRMRSALHMRTVYFDNTVQPPSSDCTILSVSPLLRELIVSMLKERPNYATHSRAFQIASLLISELQTAKSLPLHLPWPQEPRLRRLCSAMQARPSLRNDMEYWAARSNISSRTLARLFRAELGLSFHEWRSQLLLLEAQIRLTQGHSSSKVAYALGYDSHAAFSAMFRRATALSPSQYCQATERL